MKDHLHWRSLPTKMSDSDSGCIGATTFSITTLSIMGLVTTLSISDTQHNSIECHYAECRDYLNVMLSVVMLSVIMLNVIMLNVIMLSVIMLSVVAPLYLALLH